MKNFVIGVLIFLPFLSTLKVFFELCLQKMRNSLLLIILGLFTGCTMEPADADERPHYQNNSNQTVIISFQFNYPDTAIDVFNPLRAESSNTILPGQTRFDAGCCWKYNFNNNDSGVVMFFFHNLQTLKTTPWDSIRKNYTVLKRYDLTYKELINMNYFIPYP